MFFPKIIPKVTLGGKNKVHLFISHLLISSHDVENYSVHSYGSVAKF
jgi:hypothetical protein